MAGIGGIDGLHKPRRNWSSVAWGFLAGLIVGAPLGWAGPKIMKRLQRAPEKSEVRPAVVAPKPSNTQMLELLAQPAQRGLELSSSSASLQLLKPSEGKRTKQRGKRIFSGFRDWARTANYLTSGQGEFILKTANGQAVSTNWQRRDYQTFANGGILQAELSIGQPHVLFFQRKGQRAINLGTFRVNAVPVKPVAPVRPIVPVKRTAPIKPAGGQKSP